MKSPMVYTVSKTFHDFPCAHRRWRHSGHCALVHGYSRPFTIVFACSQRDANGFVFDFGDLKPVKAWLESQFDHRLCIDADDPLLPEFRAMEAKGAARLTVFEEVGMEGSAKYVFDWVQAWVQNQSEGRVWVVSVEARENAKNAATYRP